MYDTLHRQHSNDRVMMVTSGGIMNVVMNDLERLWVDEWRWREMDEAYDLSNGCIIQLSRINPVDSSQTDSVIRWRRVINPMSPENSPNTGEWIKLSPRRARTAAEILRSIANVERLLDGDGNEKQLFG